MLVIEGESGSSTKLRINNQMELVNFVNRIDDQPPSNDLSPDILVRVVKDSTNIRKIFPKNRCNVSNSKQMI